MATAILAIVAGIAIPRFARATDGARVDAAARRLVAELEAARERSKLSRSVCTVTFSVGTGRVRMAGIDTTKLGAGDGGFDLGSEPYGVVIRSTTYQASGLPFDRFGTATAGTIVLERGDRTRTVAVDPAGGVAWN